MKIKKADNLITFAVCMFLILQTGFSPLISLAGEIPAEEITIEENTAEENTIEENTVEENTVEETQTDIPAEEATAPDVPQQPEQEQEETLHDENTAENADYLQSIDVYNSILGTGGARELVRRPELDETFGGRVYMVDYGSTWNSGNFYVAARLSESAPEDAQITMRAYNLAGQEKTAVIKPSTDKRINRTSLQDKTIFDSDENGSKRAVYTIDVGVDGDLQAYKIIVNRVPELSSLKCYVDDEVNDLLETPFKKDIREYTGALQADAGEVKVKASWVEVSGFDVTINEERYEADTEKTVSATQVTNEVRIKLSRADSYIDPQYAGMSYESAGEYIITLRKSIRTDVTFTSDPEDAIICVYDSKGDRVYPEEGSGNVFSLLTDETYSYTASCYGYKTQQGEFKVQDSMDISIELEVADTKHEELTNNEWWNYRNNEENNGVTSVSTPENADEVTEKWAVHLGGDWSSSFTPPLILGGAIYTASEKFMYKIDKDTGEILAVSEELAGNMGFALNPLTYAEGLIFAQIGNGQIQALDATTLQSAWISEPLGGQTLSPITYKNGYIYSGTWKSEIEPGTYFCLSITDEDPDRKDEIKYCTWKYSHKGGFYWAGAYVSDDYAVFGSDDGSQEGKNADSSILYSVSARDGIIIDKIEGLSGDIRTSVVYDSGYVYAATKGGYLYRVKMNEDGSFGKVDSFDLGGMATASPVVYKSRIYIGVCGTGGQFNADGGHHFAVLNQTAEGISLAYIVPINGFPQAGALLSTAYENHDYDGDGKADGRVYVYFTYNSYPGGIMGFTDSPGQTSADLETYFEPEPEKQQYCISPLCIGSDGIIYYKNDSGYMMSVESNSAYLKDISAVSPSGKLSWDAEFRKSRHEYTVKVDRGTESIQLELDIPAGRTVTVNGEPCDGTYTMTLRDGAGEAEILVKHQTKMRIYRVRAEEFSQDASLADLIVSSNNNVNNMAGRIGFDREFEPQQNEYTSNIYEGSNAFLNLYAVTTEENAKMSIEAISGIKKINRFKNSPGSKSYTRYAVYFGENESEAVAEITVTAADGITQNTYRVTLLRTDVYAPNLTDVTVVRYADSEETPLLVFDSNEGGRYYYKVTESDGQVPEFELDDSAIAMTEGLNRLKLSEIGSGAKAVYLMAVDAAGNVSDEPYRISVREHRAFMQTINTNCSGPVITIKDAAGNPVDCRDGKCSLIDGNLYYVTIKADRYITEEGTFTADANVPEVFYELQSALCGNAFLKDMVVSSSDQLGKGVLKLSPYFRKDKENYEASYNGERTHLYLWAKPEDEKADIKVYAVSGVKGSTVNRDETISGEKTADGVYKWKIYFGKGHTSVKVRVQVTAEDGTKHDYFATLSVKDTTPPQLSRVSASRIAADKASVVFKTDEGGKYYYKVVDKGEKVTSVPKKSGIDILEGTVTISLSDLTKGAKDIYIQMTDHAGNESEILKMEIPDSKTALLSDKAYLTSGALTGKAAAGLEKPTLKDGDRNNLKKNDKRLSQSEIEAAYREAGNTAGSSFLAGAAGGSGAVIYAAAAIAVLGAAYLIFWLCSWNWHKSRKRRLKI